MLDPEYKGAILQVIDDDYNIYNKAKKEIFRLGSRQITEQPNETAIVVRTELEISEDDAIEQYKKNIGITKEYKGNLNLIKWNEDVSLERIADYEGESEEEDEITLTWSQSRSTKMKRKKKSWVRKSFCKTVKKYRCQMCIFRKLHFKAIIIFKIFQFFALISLKCFVTLNLTCLSRRHLFPDFASPYLLLVCLREGCCKQGWKKDHSVIIWFW